MRKLVLMLMLVSTAAFAVPRHKIGFDEAIFSYLKGATWVNSCSPEGCSFVDCGDAIPDKLTGTAAWMREIAERLAYHSAEINGYLAPLRSGFEVTLSSESRRMNKHELTRLWLEYATITLTLNPSDDLKNIVGTAITEAGYEAAFPFAEIVAPQGAASRDTSCTTGRCDCSTIGCDPTKYKCDCKKLTDRVNYVCETPRASCNVQTPISRGAQSTTISFP